MRMNKFWASRGAQGELLEGWVAPNEVESRAQNGVLHPRDNHVPYYYQNAPTARNMYSNAACKVWARASGGGRRGGGRKRAGRPKILQRQSR